MVHFHGGPITPISAAITTWQRRHACISFAYPEQMALACEVAQSVMADCGAFTKWKQGAGCVDVAEYLVWIERWRFHPAFDFCLIPDVIDGDEEENSKLVEQWPLENHISVPVWHLHESLDRLGWLVDEWPRVAFGSSGEFAQIGTKRWWGRMAEAMTVACDSEGRPKTKLHGLRMLNPTIFSQFPFSSCDSTNVARNMGLDSKWTGPYQAMSDATRALILMERIELHATAARWSGTLATQMNFELVG